MHAVAENRKRLPTVVREDKPCDNATISVANLLTHQVCTNKLYVIRFTLYAQNDTADLLGRLFRCSFSLSESLFCIAKSYLRSKSVSIADVSVRRIFYV